MVLYASPIDIALFNAFNMCADPAPVDSCRRRSVGRPHSGTPKSVQPRYNIKHVDGTSFLEVELPGVTQDDVKMEVREGTLKISGERIVGPFGVVGAEKDGDAQTSTAAGADAEMQHGLAEAGSGGSKAPENEKKDEVSAQRIKYRAEFTLPSMADVENSSAEYRNGLLSVRVPRKEPVTQSIQIGI